MQWSWSTLLSHNSLIPQNWRFTHWRHHFKVLKLLAEICLVYFTNLSIKKFYFFLFQALESGIGESFTKHFGESDNDRLRRILFKIAIPQMVDYLKQFQAKKHLEWEKSRDFQLRKKIDKNHQNTFNLIFFFLNLFHFDVNWVNTPSLYVCSSILKTILLR